jgi:NADPH:quinone reductase-like Zn-dependent oxidoreductase
VQLAKWKGAHVIASGRHKALLRELDADEFIDYIKNAPEDMIRDIDLVIDTVGGLSAGPLLSSPETRQCPIPDLPFELLRRRRG